MYSAKQKVSDAAAVAKEHVDVLKAKTEEKAKKAVATNKGQKEIAHEVRKAKEAEAKMKMHETKAVNAEEKLYGKHTVAHHHREPVGAAVPPTGAAATGAPIGGHHHHAGWTDPK